MTFRFIREHNGVTCASICLSFMQSIPVLPDIPHPVPAEAGSCCRLWVHHFPPLWQLLYHLFLLASVFSDSPPSFLRSSVPQRLSHSIWPRHEGETRTRYISLTLEVWVWSFVQVCMWWLTSACIQTAQLAAIRVPSRGWQVPLSQSLAGVKAVRRCPCRLRHALEFPF